MRVHGIVFRRLQQGRRRTGRKGAMYEVTIEQSGDFRSFIKSVVVVANGTRLKDGATGESLASPLILSDEELAVENEIYNLVSSIQTTEAKNVIAQTSKLHGSFI